MTCLNCSARATDGTYGKYSKCANCGVYFLSDVDEQTIADYYSTGTYRSRNKQPDERGHQTRRAKNIIRYIPAASVFIDIGSSAGALMDAVREKYKARCYGVDLDPILAHDVYKDINDVPEQADCVTMIHVLEHLPHPLETLRDVYGKMTDGGRLVVEVPNGEVTSGKFYSGAFSFPHVVMFSPSALRWTLEAAGFTVGDVVIHGDGGLTGAPDFYYLLMTATKA